MSAQLTWQQVLGALALQGPTSTAQIESHLVEHPRDGGLTPTLSLPRGQRATFRANLTDGSTFFVDDFGHSYEARLEQVAVTSETPASASAGPALANAVGMAALGALVGLALGQSERSAMTGALLGGALGLGSASIENAQKSPAASRASLAFAERLAALALANANSKSPSQRLHSTSPRTRKLAKATSASKRASRGAK